LRDSEGSPIHSFKFEPFQRPVMVRLRAHEWEHKENYPSWAKPCNKYSTDEEFGELLKTEPLFSLSSKFTLFVFLWWRIGWRQNAKHDVLPCKRRRSRPRNLGPHSTWAVNPKFEI
jgi:hypothetical protein